MSTPGKALTGVYFLANDAHADWALAFLESFRAHNPDLPLMLIPYDDSITTLKTWTRTYRFTIMEDAFLRRLDTLGQSFSPGDREGWMPMFRKLAAFWGPFDYAMYLDSDMVVLDDLAFLLEAFTASGQDFCYLDGTEECVYTSDELTVRMKTEHGAELFNAGYWCARGGRLSVEDVESLALGALEEQDGFYYGKDQPFLNYCVHAGGLSHSSLHRWTPGLAEKLWAAPWRRVRKDGDHYRVGHTASRDVGKRTPLLHWAGFSLSPLMPYRSLFMMYRMRPLSRREQRAYRLHAWLSYGPRQLKRDITSRFKARAHERRYLHSLVGQE